MKELLQRLNKPSEPPTKTPYPLHSDLQMKKERRDVVLKKFPTPKDFILAFTFEKANLRYGHIRSVADAYNSGVMKLNELTYIYGNLAPAHFVESWINQFQLYIGLPLETNQTIELATHLSDMMATLNVAEITLFFRLIKRGKYGTQFGRFDPIQITAWLNEFKAERGRYICSLPDNYESPILQKAKQEYYGKA
jgi:hypothetical protein